MKHTYTYPLQKIVVNVGLGKISQKPEFEQKGLKEVERSLAAITGQKPQARPSRMSIAGFKVREGQIIGLKTTLRRKRMMDFLNKTNNIVLPRIRDFRGISLRGIDQNGNLTFGIKEHIVFPEIVLEEVNTPFGLEITLVPKVKMAKQKAIDFYRELGLPLEKEKKQK